MNGPKESGGHKGVRKPAGGAMRHGLPCTNGGHSERPIDPHGNGRAFVLGASQPSAQIGAMLDLAVTLPEPWVVPFR
jgi:hypothetical protein